MTADTAAAQPSEIQVFPMAGDDIATNAADVEFYDVLVTDEDGGFIEEHERLDELQMKERLLELALRFPELDPNMDLIDQLDHDYGPDWGPEDGRPDNMKDLFPPD